MNWTRLALIAAGGYAFYRIFLHRDTSALPAELAYLTVTSTGIDNTPPASLIPALQRLHQFVKAVRRNYGAVEVTSGYRTAAVNEAVGGVPSSLHLQGRAVDITPLEVSAEKIYSDWKGAAEQLKGLLQETILYTVNGKPVRLHVGLAATGAAPAPRFFRREKSAIGVPG